MIFHFVERSDVESLFRQAGRQVELNALSARINELLVPPADREAMHHQYVVATLAQHELIEEQARLLAQFAPLIEEDHDGLHPGT